MAQDFAALDMAHQAAPTNFAPLDDAMAFATDEQAQAYKDDNKLFVQFYNRNLRNEAKSLEEKRAIFETHTFILIKIPGDKYNDVNRIASEHDKARFPIQFAKFEKGQEQIVGTPLDALPFLTSAQVEEYKYLHVRTVEQMAGMADALCQRVMGAIVHKQKAQEWLDTFKDADKLRAEFNAKAEAQQKELDSLKAQLAALTAAKDTQKQKG